MTDPDRDERNGDDQSTTESDHPRARRGGHLKDPRQETAVTDGQREKRGG